MRHRTWILSLAALALATACQTAPKPAAGEALAFAQRLGLGYNLGNTLEATGGTRGNKIANFEVAWGAPITTADIFVDLKARGFSSIRIPVAWSNLVGPNHAIHPDLMNRVEEVVNMVLDADLYAIVNIHWDGGWIHDFPTDWDGTMERYLSYWKQISDRFKKYDQRVIFESMNEEGSFDNVWNRWTDGDSSPKKQAAFDVLNVVNQAFVDLVRHSGGNNATRYLLIAGYGTDIDLTCGPEFVMPKDPAGRQMVSVHYYTPSTFAIIDQDATWGKSARFWGTDAEVAQVAKDFAKVKARFIDRGIPVVLGEYGTVINNKDPDSVRKYLTVVAQTAWKFGLVPMLWSGSGDHYDRVKKAFADPAIAQMYLELSQTPRP